MAILPSKNAISGKSAAGARFRQRKISVKVSLPIYNQKELSGGDLELEPSQLHHLNAAASEQPRELHAIETGVDKNEEDEVHLQQVINAAQRVLLGSVKEKGGEKETSSVYIPTPDASKIWAEAPRYYNDKSFVEPESYIKFSATVEDTLGVEYNMDEEDEDFFINTLSKTYPLKSDKDDADSAKKRPCTELEFETLCDKFEKMIEEKQPFLSMDPSTILTFEELSSLILEEFNSSANKDHQYVLSFDSRYIPTSTLKEKLAKELNFEPFVTTFDKNRHATTSTRSIPQLLELFGEPIYEHWKKRKILRKGSAITPSLKFEDPNANEKDNDNDPYICFRRREFRQARKTRRADNLGAERIRLLQKSLKKARELVLNVCKRELLKLQSWESDYEIFKLRCEAKGVKRAVGIKGDDYLFYPHKRKKIIKVEPEEDTDMEVSRSRKERKKQQESGAPFAQVKDQRQLPPEASSTQPYVKLPPSKIPDMDLVTVSLVLKEKNESIKRAVLEKLRKRKDHDKGYVNITYDPYQPFFNISTNYGNKNLELSHIPYSSIASTYYHQINTTNVISDHLKKLLEETKKPYPGMKTFRGSNGELIPSKPFPHLQTLLNDHLNSKGNASQGYIAQLLSNIENNNFNTYSNGFWKQSSEEDDEEEKLNDVSDPIFRLRKRAGRGNRIFVDRKGLMQRPDDVIDEWMNLDVAEEDQAESTETTVPNDAYHNKFDELKRMDSRWKFDDDYPEYDKGIRSPFSLDPSRLNSISDDTQSIRFGSMLLSKSYDLLRESALQRQALIQQARKRALQQHQLNRAQQGANGAPVPNGTANGMRTANALASSSGNAGTFRRTAGPGNYGAGSTSGSAVPGAAANRAGAGRPAANYTPQQLQAMQQFRQQLQQQLQQNSANFLAQKRAAAMRTKAGSMSPASSNSLVYSSKENR